MGQGARDGSADEPKTRAKAQLPHHKEVLTSWTSVRFC
jgi:hypothetical protein